MAEVLVSTVLEKLASIMHQQAEERIRLIVSVDEEMGKITRNLQAIQAVLIDAEKKQVKEIAARDWLDKVKDVSYDVDNVLDEWNTTLRKLQTKKAEEAFMPLRKVCSLIPYYLCCGRTFILHYGIAVRIRNLDRKLDIIAKETDSFQFSSITEGTTEEEDPERQMPTSIIDITEVHGRDEEKNRLRDMLLRQSGHEQVVPIISIVGLAGIGKSTLARIVFNDDKVKTHFDKKIWVHASKCFDAISIAREILKSIKIGSDLVEVDPFQEIHLYTQNEKVLVILDDVVLENLRNWEELKHTLNNCSERSRILVTMLKENVAKAIGTTQMMTLGTLLYEECWAMFSEIAFSEKTREECEILTKTGEEIVKKCKGLPLAIKLLASLLRFKRKIKEWQDVLDSEIWELEDVEQGLLPSLLLSYYDLPSILKKCFSYCAIFPKDYEIDKDELIKLWMAQDYLKAKNNKDMELVGEEYFKILAMRSYFQDFKKDLLNDLKSFKMHDAVHNFAQFLTRNECFILEEDGYGESKHEPSYKKFRHSMTKVHRDGSLSSFIYTQKLLHTLAVVSEFRRYKSTGLSKLFDQLTCLRTLNLSDQDFKEIPKRINKLIHLRYLNLSQNAFTILPETLCELYNLQILNISLCWVQKLPQGIGKLINLRCLENRKTPLTYMPKSFEKLIGIRTLDKFVVSESDGGHISKVACSVECLKNLESLQKINIKGLGRLRLRGVDKAKEVELCNKKNLRVLTLGFQYGSEYGDHVGVLEALQPPRNLEKLKIKYYNGCTLFPDWITSLTNLRELCIKRSVSCEHLYGLGKLSSLEYLEIWFNRRIKRVGSDFLGIESDVTSSSSSLTIFPKLKFLWFYNIKEWEEWNYEIKERGEVEITIMPSLQTLKIEDCPKLKSLPDHLRHMTTLKMEIRDCPLLEEEIERSDRSSPSFDEEFSEIPNFDLDMFKEMNFEFSSS